MAGVTLKQDQRSLGQPARRGGKEQSVTPAQLGAASFALQDLHLVAKDEDLYLAVA